MLVTIDRTELMDYLLQREFGPLLPSLSGDASSLDWKLSEAGRLRDLAMRGLEDPRPAIERRLAAYLSLSDEHFQATVQKAKEEDQRQAKSLERVLEAVRAGAWLRWARKDLWSQGELAALCCGLIPDDYGMTPDPGRTNSDSIRINSASGEIAKGVLSKNLEFISHSDVSTADRLYGSARHFRPHIAVAWAVDRFETFPKELADAVGKRKKAGGGNSNPRIDQKSEHIDLTLEESIDPRERVTMLRLIRALSKMANLPPRGSAAAISKQLDELGFMKPREATIRSLINEASALEPEKPQ